MKRDSRIFRGLKKSRIVQKKKKFVHVHTESVRPD